MVIPLIYVLTTLLPLRALRFFLFEANQKGDLGSFCLPQPGAPRPDLSECLCSGVIAHVALISSHESSRAGIKCTKTL